MIKDEIEKIICDRYLRGYVHNKSAQPRTDQSEAESLCKIKTIFSGLHFTRETRRAQNHYVLETREGLFTNVDSPDKRPTK